MQKIKKHNTFPFPTFIKDKLLNPKHMKKLRIIEDALVEYCIVPQATDELRAIKLTKEQAYRSDFWDEDAEFEDLVAKYGQENILDVGEFYDGFCFVMILTIRSSNCMVL